MRGATVFLLGAIWALAAVAGPAEYAVRWDPSHGGPASASEVLNYLKLQGVKTKKFNVRYFVIVQSEKLPTGYSVIGRERLSSGQTEATYKVRGPAPRPQELAGWMCPLSGNHESKAEIDVSWTGDAVPKRSFSLSCSVVKSTILDALPPGYSAMAKDCESKVERYKAGGLKIERWVLPEGKVVFEVSMEGEDTQADLERFETLVVKPLLEQKMAPMKETKTELGGQC